ncbi:MAG TPA: class I SAM-dependent methyltransferase [Polyangia bacterium]
MLRGLAHASLLFTAAHVPGGARAYHALTRGLLGSQRRVLRKLQRVWPGYVGVWRDRCGLTLAGRTVWIHEPGPVPFAPLAAYLLSGRGGLVTATVDPPSDRYAAAAVRAVLDAGFTVEDAGAPARRATLARLPRPTVDDLLRETGARAVLACDPSRLPLDDGSADLCHSGGVLEHYRPDALAAFLRQSFRVLRPGGIASHVYDHRDHLRHVDPSWPFLAHMALPEAVHRTLCGHRLLFHNRLAPTEVLALFEAAGFERIAVRRFVLPDKRYVDAGAARAGEAGVPAWLRTGRLGRLSLEDRHTAAIHYLFRKPERS